MNVIKRKIIILFLLSLQLIFISEVYNAQKTIKVGVYTYNPLIFRDSNNQEQGLFIDVIKYIAEKEKWKLEFVFGTWEECFTRLLSEEIDVLPVITKSPEREQSISYTEDSLFLDWAVIYARKNSGFKTIFDLANRRIGILKKDIFTDAFKKLTSNFGIKPVFVEFTEYSHLFDSIRRGEIDAGVNGNFYGSLLEDQYHLEKTQIVFSAVKYYFGLKKGKNSFIEQTINYYVKKMKADPHSIYFRSYEKWLGSKSKELRFPIWATRIIIGLIALSLLTIIFVILLQLQIKKKTFALNKKNQEYSALIKSLTLSEESFKNLFELVGVGLVQIESKTNNIIRVNQRFSIITGYQKDEILNQNFFDNFIFTNAVLDLEDLSNLLKSSSENYQTEEKFIRKDGAIIWVNLTITPSASNMNNQGYYIAVLDDVTEKVQASERIQVLANFPLENPNPVMQISDKGEFLFYNKASEKLVEQLKLDTENQALYSIFHKSIEALKNKEIIRYEYRLGSIVYLVNLAPINDFNYVNVYCTDITELKEIQAEKENLIVNLENTLTREKESLEELEASYEELASVHEELERSNVELDAALKTAESANTLKTEFLANMSHEIRTPLTAILGFNNILLMDKNLTPQQKENLALVKRSGERLLNLLMDILLVSQIEVGKVFINKSVTDLQKLTEEIQDVFSLRLKEKNNRLLFRLNGIENLYTDEKRLNQILMNLVGNAIKFTDHGEILVEVQIKKGVYQFSVKDTGEGIKPEILDKIFDSFVVGESGYTKSYQGAGLGLTICKRLVHLLGGEIWAESEHKTGSTFYFNIPVELPPKNTDIIENSIKQPFDFQSNAKLFIAMIDDEPLILEYVNKLIQKSTPHQIDIYESCEKFLSEIHLKTYDLVFMDIRMPDMNGIECLSVLKKTHAHLPVIALTAFSMADEREKIAGYGFDDYLTKPIDTDEFLKLINRHAAIKSFK